MARRWLGEPPFGYAAIEAERRGEKVKKKLAICEPEAAIARRIFDLYRGIEGLQHRVKAIAVKLNADGVTFGGKVYLKLFVDNVIISKEEIRVSGPKGVLAKAAMNDLPNTPGEVITFVREWRAKCDETGHWKLLISLASAEHHAI